MEASEIVNLFVAKLTQLGHNTAIDDACDYLKSRAATIAAMDDPIAKAMAKLYEDAADSLKSLEK